MAKGTEQATEDLGLAIDRLDNLAHALKLPISANIHVDQLRIALPEVVAELKKQFALVTGENPWD